jgi:hypothetical protein
MKRAASRLPPTACGHPKKAALIVALEPIRPDAGDRLGVNHLRHTAVVPPLA